VIPTDHAPAGIGQTRGERVERAGEVESAVGEHQWGSVGIAPLVDRDTNATGVDAILTVGCTPARDVGERWRTGRHVLEARQPDVRFENLIDKIPPC
jgi:hypothetical protein